MHTYKNYLNGLFTTELQKVSGFSDCNANVITSSRPEFGDYQVNGIMSVAKRLKTNPRDLATKLLESIEVERNDYIDTVEIAGPGFINIHLNNLQLLERGNELLSESGSLISPSTEPETIVVDYSSPNLAKEMHVGHLRGTIIGDCLVRVLEALNHKVIRQNHVGDWGTQFGMLISHMEDVANEESSNELADLEEFYRAAKDRFDSESDFAERARANVVKLQSGDPDFLKSWKLFIDESLSHCQAVYDTLNVTLDRTHLDAESLYNDILPIIISELDDKKLLSVSDGAKVVFLPEFIGKDGEPLPVIIQKSDGGYLYSTTDLAAIKRRVSHFKADRSLYVVDARQSLHFQQVFSVARAAGYANERISLEHIAYGTMMGKDGKPFKTRSGDTVKLVELLNEGVKRAFDLVSEKNPSLDKTERELIGREVGIAAVKYADLSKNRTSDYIFDWSTMLSFEGNTAPYLMYAYARINSVLQKSELEFSSFKITQCTEKDERNLLLKLLQFPEVVDAVAKDCYPNTLCNYLFELAGLFMKFYEACPILKESDDIKTSRLALCMLAAKTLKEGLGLLGINTLEKM